MAHSFDGKILHVDLTHGTITVEEPPESFYRTYGGGSAMGVHYVLKETPPKVDALAPENTFTLMIGVPTGLAISGNSRVTATAKSPLTGTIGDAQAGGYWPAELKFAGFDGIVIKGKSPKPAYLWIHEGKAELRDASKLWGKITGEVQDAIQKELGDEKIQVLQIGPAGEKLSRIACLINMCCRANGRTGMGAVMGSKNLKAVAVRGTQRPAVADPEGFHKVVKQAKARLPSTEGLGVYGTAGVVSPQNAGGTLPTHNWDMGQFADHEKINGETMADTILKDRDTCYACAIRCKRVLDTDYKGTPIVPRYGGPEYETIATFGSYCDVNDLKAISLANQICNQYGLDTIACGATIAFAMDCFEHELITTKDTGGIELKFGHADAMVKMTEMMARRQGFGVILADGAARAARHIGKNAADYLVTVKGGEAPAHMPQAKKSLALIYACNPFGMDHMSHEHDPSYEAGAGAEALRRMALLGLTKPQPPGSLNEEKVNLAWTTQKLFSALDSYNLCQFCWGASWQLCGPDNLAALLEAATGWDVTVDEILKVGERRINLMRAFNAREGFTREDDRLPKKLLVPLQGTGPTAGVKFDAREFEHVKDLYYQHAGWDVKTGNPTKQHLKSLGLDWIK